MNRPPPPMTPSLNLETLVMVDNTPEDPLETYLQQTIILDTQGPLIYIGILHRVTATYLILRDCDVHDSNDSRASKDLYLVETRDLGVRANRGQVLVARGQIASISLLRHVVD